MNPESAIRERLAVCSWSLKPTGPQDLVEKLQATGVKRVQLALDPLRQAPTDWAQTPALLSAAGITVVSGMVTCLGEDYSTLETIRATGGISPDATWPANLANFEAAAELARDLGLTLVTLHAGFLPHDEADPAYGKLLARLRKVAAVFAARRIKVGLETGQETAEDLAQFLEQLQEPNVGVNFDPANMLLYDKGAPLAALRTLSKWILQVHLKDAVRTKTPGTWGEEVALGTGEVEWPAFFRTLRQQGYLGNFAIEREAGEQRIPDIRTAAEVAERSFLAEKTAPAGATEISATGGKVNVAVVGLGFMGVTHLRAYQAAKNARIVAVCDAVRLPVNGVLAGVAGNIKKSDDINLGPGVKVYRKLEELLADPDVQAVDLCTPTPLHPEQAKAALQAGKHVLCEKPLARTIAEQQAIVRAVEKHKIIWQTGSWQRSLPLFHKAAEIVRNGLIGNVTHVEIGLPGAPHDFPNTVPALLARLAGLPDKIKDPSQIIPGTAAWDLAVTQTPADFDYDRWIGPSQMEPYIDARVYQNWRWNYNTGGGQLLDWIGHHGDIAHWGLGFDATGPSVVSAFGDFPAKNAVWNVATKYTVSSLYRKEVTGYANDVHFTIAGGSPAISTGTKWIGPDGWVWVDRSGFDASNPEWLKEGALPEKLISKPVFASPGHHRNFLDSVKSRKPTITPVETAHHSLIPGHLGLISMLTGRTIHWDPKTETIANDAEASALLTRSYRAGYKLG